MQTETASGSWPAELWQPRLNVAGHPSKLLTAFSNLKKVCESYLKSFYCITVIDWMKKSRLANGDQILAIPTVVRKVPKPVRIILGNLSDAEHLLVGLNLRPVN